MGPLNFNILKQISGIKNYIVVEQNGKVLTHDVGNPQKLSSAILINAMNCNTAKSIAGFTDLEYILLKTKSNEKIIILPFNKGYLGIVASANSHVPEIITQVKTKLK